MTPSRRTPPAKRDVASAYDEHADTYDHRYAATRTRERHERVESPMLELAHQCRRVLELGSGTGRITSKLCAPHVVGIDLSVRSLGIAKQKGLLVAAGDCEQLPFANASFDAVLAPNGVFRYLNYAQAFRECARVLVRGGSLMVHQFAARTWTPRSFWKLPGADNPLHVQDLAELHQPARQAGFLPTKTWRWRATQFPPYAVRIPPWLNAPLWSQCVIEYRRSS